MPSSKVHEVVNLACLPGALLVPEPVEQWWFVGGYIFGTFMLSPDLDMQMSRPASRWWVLRGLWLPYGRIAAHRGRSHKVLVGLFLRLLYLLGLVGVIVFVASSFDVHLLTVPWSAMGVKLMSLGLGLFVADILHIFLDSIVTRLKRSFGLSRRRRR